MILTHQKGRGTKVHLYLDGEYVATTDENCWFDNYISNETDINDEQWQQLLAKINYKKALNKCADYLSRRDYSAKEIKAKLLKTVDETSAQKAVDRYIEAGYINDEKYCQRLIEYLLNVKKFSLTNIKQECYKRGISRDIVDEKLIRDPTPPTSTSSAKRKPHIKSNRGSAKTRLSLFRHQSSMFQDRIL